MVCPIDGQGAWQKAAVMVEYRDALSGTREADSIGCAGTLYLSDCDLFGICACLHIEYDRPTDTVDRKVSRGGRKIGEISIA